MGGGGARGDGERGGGGDSSRGCVAEPCRAPATQPTTPHAPCGMLCTCRAMAVRPTPLRPACCSSPCLFLCILLLSLPPAACGAGRHGTRWSRVRDEVWDDARVAAVGRDGAEAAFNK